MFSFLKLQLCADPNVKIVGGTNWDSPPRDLFIYNDFGLAGNEMFTSLGALFTYLRSIVHILLACMLESIQDLNFRLGIQTFSTENWLNLDHFSPKRPGPDFFSFFNSYEFKVCTVQAPLQPALVDKLRILILTLLIIIRTKNLGKKYIHWWHYLIAFRWF